MEVKYIKQSFRVNNLSIYIKLSAISEPESGWAIDSQNSREVIKWR